ncbi:Cytochrome P450 [Mycena sanguinolenta]|uniref:Cytochrome P450 n=1 Tax=Mycena sanguinolenta TaxID=230812 RepID=A0A8H6Y3G9_9AGAR|nr:Cytochrome P450 [Mycena sanguinolenta]
MPLSPGIGYLATQLPRILTPPLLVYCAKLVTELRLGIIVPTWLTTLACVLSGPAVLTVVVQYRDYQNRRQAAAHGAIIPPAVPGSIGGLNMLFANIGDMYPAEPLSAVASELGSYTMTIRFLFQNRIMTAEPENIKAILATEFDAFEKGSEFRGLMEPLLGTGVFAADGKYSPLHTRNFTEFIPWRRHVEMTRPFFHRERISDFDLFDHHATKAIAQLKARLREGYAADFQDMVARFTMDTSSSFLFGKDVRSLDAGLPYPHNVTTDAASVPAAHPSSVFATAFQEAQTITSLRSRFGEHWPLREFWVDELEKPMRIVREFLDPILEEAVARKRATGQAIQEKDKTNELGDRQVQEGESLLDHLVNYTDDHTILRDELLNLTAAGRDTTAGLLTFTIYMLAEHPEVLTKLREEIFRFVGPTTRPTYDNFRDMKYLRAVLNGKMPHLIRRKDGTNPLQKRFDSIVRPFNVRTALQPILFRSSNNGPPLFVPAGTRCAFSTILMHRRKDLWGPDALEFDPERFLDERLHKYLTPNPFIFLPFNGGPRICLGQQFAYHEASFFLVRLLQTFSSVSLDLAAQPLAARPPASWKTDDKSGWTAHEKIRPRSHLTMFVFGGLWVRMKEADAIAEGK